MALTKRWRFSTTQSGTFPAAGAHAGLRAVGRALTRLCPHRLLWPKSKSFDYLYGVGEKLLETFPVQATICFYEESGSEEEEEEEEEEEGEEAGDTVAGPDNPGRTV